MDKVHEKHDQTWHKTPKVEQATDATIEEVKERETLLEFEFDELEKNSELDEAVARVHREWVDLFDNVEQIISPHVNRRENIPSTVKEFLQYPSDNACLMHVGNVYVPKLNAWHDQTHGRDFRLDLKLKITVASLCEERIDTDLES